MYCEDTRLFQGIQERRRREGTTTIPLSISPGTQQALIELLLCARVYGEHNRVSFLLLLAHLKSILLSLSLLPWFPLILLADSPN